MYKSKMRTLFLNLNSLLLCTSLSGAFVIPQGNTIKKSSIRAATGQASATTASTSPKSKSPIFEYLKFDGSTPNFDVIEKTIEYVKRQETSKPFSYEEIFDDDYVLRGPVIGPIDRADLQLSQKGLGLFEAYPNVRVDSFGFTIDPENPYRCLYFSRWRSVHEGDLDVYGQIYPATGVEAETPISVFSIVWTPQGKIIYEQVGAVVDRFEGNTQGKAAVFGLLHNAGLMISGSPGGVVTRFTQRMGHFIGGLGRSWSEESKIPSWWKSKSRGADETDQF